jgi:hypothetical protein
VRFDTKIAIVLRDDLETWQKLNVTAFLASGRGRQPELLGEPYADADGTLYTPMFRQPVLVFEADKAVLDRRARAGVGARPADGRLHRRAVRHRARRGEPGRGRRGAARRAGPRGESRSTGRATPSTRRSRARSCTADATAERPTRGGGSYDSRSRRAAGSAR